MKLVIEIPNAFKEHFSKDRFVDSLKRISADIQYGLENKIFQLAGNYEKELVDVLVAAFHSATDSPFKWKHVNTTKPPKQGWYWIEYINPDEGAATIYTDCLYAKIGDTFMWSTLPLNVPQENVILWCEMPGE